MSAYSFHVSFDHMEFELIAAIPSVNQCDTSYGCLHNALASSIKKLWSGAFWQCLRVLSGNARASGILVKGYDKASSFVLMFPTSNPNPCQSSWRMSVLFAASFLLETSCYVVMLKWFKNAYFFICFILFFHW